MARPAGERRPTPEPIAFASPHVAISPRTALYVRVARRLLEERGRRDGVTLPADVVDELDDVDRLAAWETARAQAERPERHSGTFGTPSSPSRAAALTVTVGTVEAARRLGVSQRAVRARLGRGTLRGQRVGGTWWVDLDDLNRLAPAQREEVA